MKDMLNGIGKFISPAQAAAVREKIGKPLLDKLQQLSTLAWVGLGDYLVVTRAIRSTVGPAGYRDFWRKIGKQTYDNPLMKGIFVVGFKMFGLTPKTFAQMLPSLMNVGYRNFGQVTVGDLSKPNECEILHKGYPPILADEPGYLDASADLMSGIYDVTGYQGSIHASIDPKARAIVFKMTWQLK
ncbi:MAG: hypothetical protein ACT4TC_14590 [Myxococcaceae bacterium]